MKRRLTAILLCALLLCAALAGCGGGAASASAPAASTAANEAGTDAGAGGKGVIKVGISGDFFPFCFTENDESQGFEVDVWNEIGSRAGYEVAFMVSDFTGLLGMLDSGKVDTVAHSVAINAEREEKYDFSVPYVYSNYNLVTLKDSGLVALEDFAGKSVGAVMGGEGEKKLIALSDEKGLDINVVGYEGTAAMDEDVMMGRIDARLGPAIQTSATIAKNDLDMVVTDVTVFSETAGYPFPKDGQHEQMLADVDGAITAMQADGTLAEFSEKWFSLDATKPA